MKNILLGLCFLFIFPVGSMATPPTSISLSYDLDKASLHVDAVHESDILDKSYVRMMTVSLNGEPVQSLYYTRQLNHEGFSDDVSIKAQVGDVITVEVFCTLGGSLAQSLTVTKPQSPSDQGGNTNSETTINLVTPTNADSTTDTPNAVNTTN
jgi:hypothetical protein